jgi:hypothetical protein
MAVNLLPGGLDQNGIVTEMNKNLLDLKGKETTEIFKDDTGTRRVLLGKGADGFYGLKVSKPSFDVYDTGDGNLVFNSDQNVFKISQRTRILTSTGFSFSCPSFDVMVVDQVDSYTHGLGFTPQINGSIVDTNGYFPIPFTSQTDAATGVLLTVTCQAFADATYVSTYVQAAIMNFSGTPVTGNIGAYDFRLYLLRETAN